MKKFVVLFVAVMLAVPAMSYAGSATSRWDLSIGGMVKVDYTYTDQSLSEAISGSERDAMPGNVSSRQKYGASTWGIGDTRLNFLVKGPDTWGAKTSAFVEMAFRGMGSASVAANVRSSYESYGTATLSHAFMKFDWPSFSLLIGKTFTVPGALPCFCVLANGDLGSFNRGGLKEQAYGAWQATKQVSVTFGVMNAASLTGWPGGTTTNGLAFDDGYQRSLWPLFFTELLWKSDACGKIGPWMLQFGLGGVYGKERPISPAFFGPAGDTNSAGSANTVSSTTISGVQFFNPNGYDSDYLDTWMLTFKTYIPIIPEKAPGKLANALSLAFSMFTAQDYRFLAGPTPCVQADFAYNRADYGRAISSTAAAAVTGGQPSGLQASQQAQVPRADYHAPVVTGGWGQLAYHFTDTVWAGFYYGTYRTALSYPRKATISPGAQERLDEYTVNLVYDPNPALRFGIQWDMLHSHWARPQYGNTTAAGEPAGFYSGGTVNQVRVAAYYFF